jgi:hypothetical protein
VQRRCASMHVHLSGAVQARTRAVAACFSLACSSFCARLHAAHAAATGECARDVQCFLEVLPIVEQVPHTAHSCQLMHVRDQKEWLVLGLLQLRLAVTLRAEHFQCS